jgi:hypothetical protein
MSNKLPDEKDGLLEPLKTMWLPAVGESLWGRTGEGERQVEGLFASLLNTSFGESIRVASHS